MSNTVAIKALGMEQVVGGSVTRGYCMHEEHVSAHAGIQLLVDGLDVPDTCLRGSVVHSKFISESYSSKVPMDEMYAGHFWGSNTKTAIS